jgi:hypothetical protein
MSAARLSVMPLSVICGGEPSLGCGVLRYSYACPRIDMSGVTGVILDQLNAAWGRVARASPGLRCLIGRRRGPIIPERRGRR